MARILSKFYINEEDKLERSITVTWVILWCPKCGGSVIEAEEMVTAKSKWYKRYTKDCVVHIHGFINMYAGAFAEEG